MPDKRLKNSCPYLPPLRPRGRGDKVSDGLKGRLKSQKAAPANRGLGKPPTRLKIRNYSRTK